MEIGQEKQIRLGTALSYLQTVVSVLLSLVYTPVMLSLLGQNEYGLYNLAATTISYVALLNAGLSGSYVRFYSRAKASGEDGAVTKTNGLFSILFFAIGVLALLGGGALTFFAEGIFADGLSAAEYAKGKAIMLILTVSTAYELATNLYPAVIVAHERFVFHKIINLLKTVLGPALTWVLLLCGYRSLMMAAVSAALVVVTNTCYWVYCIRKLHVKVSVRHPSSAKMREISVFAGFIVLIALVDQVNWSVDKLLLGRMWGTAQTAVYSIAATIHLLYMQLSCAISNVFIPRVNRMVAEGEGKRALSDCFIRIGRMQTMVLLPVLIGFAFFGQAFISLWTPGGYEEAYYAALLLLFASFVPYIQNIALSIQAAQNKHRFRSCLLGGVAICNFVLSLFLCRLWGVVGCAIGTALSVFLGDGVVMNIYYRKAVGLDIARFFKSMAGFLPAAILLSVGGFLLSYWLKPGSWPVLILCGALFCLLYVVLLYTTALSPEERAALHAMLPKKTKK